jgi:hypothetical protein
MRTGAPSGGTVDGTVEGVFEGTIERMSEEISNPELGFTDDAVGDPGAVST